VFSYLLYKNEVGRIIRSKGHWVSWLLCTEAVLLNGLTAEILHMEIHGAPCLTFPEHLLYVNWKKVQQSLVLKKSNF